MRILVTGGAGQLGKALQEVLPKKNSFFADIEDFDITDRKKTLDYFTTIKPQIVIHAAAYTDVDGSEKNKQLAFKVNRDGAENVARACEEAGAVMVYLSTDYVFDGKKKTPYIEKDRPNPQGIYAQSKFAGEKEVQKILKKYFILRTAWLFGQGPRSAQASAGKNNFPKTILKLAQKQDEIKVVKDQFGCPTYALDLAKAIYQIISNVKIQMSKFSLFGIYHLTNAGCCSWFEFAQETIKLAGLRTKIIPITTKQWQQIKPQGAPRPKYTVLDCSKIKKLGIKMRCWRGALRDYLRISEVFKNKSQKYSQN